MRAVGMITMVWVMMVAGTLVTALETFPKVIAAFWQDITAAGLGNRVVLVMQTEFGPSRTSKR